MRQQLAAVLREDAEEVELVRRELHALAAARDDAFRDVDAKLADVDHRLG